MMKEEFDFKKIGKRMPYKVPADFFDTITERTLSEAENRANGPKKQKPVLWSALSVAASVAIIFTLGYVLYTGSIREGDKISKADNAEAVSADSLFISVPEHSVATLNRQHKEVESEANPLIEPAQQQQQLAATDKPETLDEILATVSDEELRLLAAIAETDLYVYQQTFD